MHLLTGIVYDIFCLFKSVNIKHVVYNMIQYLHIIKVTQFRRNITPGNLEPCSQILADRFLLGFDHSFNLALFSGLFVPAGSDLHNPISLLSPQVLQFTLELSFFLFIQFQVRFEVLQPSLDWTFKQLHQPSGNCYKQYCRLPAFSS